MSTRCEVCNGQDDDCDGRTDKCDRVLRRTARHPGAQALRERGWCLTACGAIAGQVTPGADDDTLDEIAMAV